MRADQLMKAGPSLDSLAAEVRQHQAPYNAQPIESFSPG